MKKAALIVAGGTGTRMGSERPKQFLLLGGRPILMHTLDRYLALDPKLPLQLVLPANEVKFWFEDAPQWFRTNELARIEVCEGGASRTESVHKGLEALQTRLFQPESYFVAIHDGVRPFIHTERLMEAYQIAAQRGASVACVPVKSSIRMMSADGGSQAVDRSLYYHVQTPQTFAFSRILKAYRERPEGAFTDDASLYQAMGGEVVICEGSYDNLKITTPEDLLIAEQILTRWQAAASD
ncbi:MAG: 2-C-methyl-D-erythritol 4-phosphate cytidylyltransferase [Bacteroidota bacterium]